jgi:hypothetical protein
MPTALRNRPTSRPTDPDALIREARRRQRIRYLLTAGALLALCGTGTGLLYATTLRSSSRPGRPSHGTPGPSAAASWEPTVPRLPPIDAKVLMWPLGHPLGVGDYSGPPLAFDDLRTGRYFQTGKIDLCCGDYQPLMIMVGRWLVFVGNGATAIRANLSGRPRVLGRTPYFAPSATPGDVWLEYPGSRGYLGSGVMRIRQVPVAGGAAGPAITLPAGAQLVAGTRAGLLLENRSGRLRLWLRGQAMRVLSGNPSWADGFAVTPGLIAYGTHCRDAFIPAKAAFEPNSSYPLCGSLRVFDVRSGRVDSFRSPVGTSGWVPPEFGLENPITPSGSLMAAEAVVPSPDNNRGRLYVLPIAGDDGRPMRVPASAGHIFSKAAWSPDGSWLLYQGPRFTLWGYNVHTHAVRSSPVPCCRYTIMAVVRAH